MTTFVKVTRKGQTTIPASTRRKFHIKQGDCLAVEETERGILLRPVPRLQDLAGIDVGYATPEELYKILEKMRDEY